MIYSELYKEGTAILQKADISEAALDARLLLEYICGTDRNTLFAHPELELSENQEKKYLAIIKKRSEHIPLQHLTGLQEFMGLEFLVSEKVLIPRQDTEFLVEEVLRYAEDGMSILDMCTGSACILLSILNYKNDCRGVGCDISEAALEIARKNAQKLNIEADFYQGDLFEALINAPDEDKMFDIIVSNPPYIRESEIENLMPEVREHDPYIALCGGEDGFDFYRSIVGLSREYLKNYGKIFLEIGYDQNEGIRDILTENGFENIQILKDYAGNYRVAIATIIK